MAPHNRKVYESLITRAYEAFVLNDSPYPLIKMGYAIAEVLKTLENWRQFGTPADGTIVAGIAYYKYDAQGQWLTFDRNTAKWVPAIDAPVAWKEDLDIRIDKQGQETNAERNGQL